MVIVVDYELPCRNDQNCAWCGRENEENEKVSVYLRIARDHALLKALMCRRCQKRFTVPVTSAQIFKRRKVKQKPGKVVIPPQPIVTPALPECNCAEKGHRVLFSDAVDTGTCSNCTVLPASERHWVCIYCGALKSGLVRETEEGLSCEECYTSLVLVDQAFAESHRPRCSVTGCIRAANCASLWEWSATYCVECAIPGVHISVQSQKCQCWRSTEISRHRRPRMLFGSPRSLVPRRCILCRATGDVDLSNSHAIIGRIIQRVSEKPVRFVQSARGYRVANIKIRFNVMGVVVIGPPATLPIPMDVVERIPDEDTIYCVLVIHPYAGFTENLAYMTPASIFRLSNALLSHLMHLQSLATPVTEVHHCVYRIATKDGSLVQRLEYPISDYIDNTPPNVS